MTRWVLFIGVVQSILFLSHWLLYWTLVRFFSVCSSGKLFALRITLGLLSISLVLTSFLAFRCYNLLVRWLYTLAASWLGILYLLVLASIICWFLYGLARLFHAPLDRKLLIEILIGMAITTSIYGFINSGLVRVTRVNIRLRDLPASWKGRTAVWVSDTHLGQVRNVGFARHIAGMVQNLRPDIIFYGGDLFDGVAVDRDKVIGPFSRIRAPRGSYFITGNHEEFGNSAPYLAAVRRAGIRVLDNEKVEIDGLQILGVDYRDTRDEKQFRIILRQIRIDPHTPSILLKHTPLHLEVPRDEGISLQLSGHTHRGQVFLFHFITSKVYRGYDYGLKYFGPLLVQTSSGAGTWGPPMRIDTTPEIVLITFL